MKKDELYREFLFSTSRRGTHYDGSNEWNQMMREMNQQATERRLELEKQFGKPRSKYHR